MSHWHPTVLRGGSCLARPLQRSCKTAQSDLLHCLYLPVTIAKAAPYSGDEILRVYSQQRLKPCLFLGGPCGDLRWASCPHPQHSPCRVALLSQLQWLDSHRTFPAAQWRRVDPRKSLGLFRVVELTEGPPPPGKHPEHKESVARNRNLLRPVRASLAPQWPAPCANTASSQGPQERAPVPKPAATHVAPSACCCLPGPSECSPSTSPPGP